MWAAAFWWSLGTPGQAIDPSVDNGIVFAPYYGVTAPSWFIHRRWARNALGVP